MAKTTNGNKKERGFFKVDDDKVFDLIDKLRRVSDVEVSMVTCSELLVVWKPSRHTKDDIQKMLK